MDVAARLLTRHSTGFMYFVNERFRFPSLLNVQQRRSAEADAKMNLILTALWFEQISWCVTAVFATAAFLSRRCAGPLSFSTPI